MTSPHWPAIEEEYKKGGVSCRQLAEKYGLKAGAVESRCTRLGWKKENAGIAEKVQERVIESLSAKAQSYQIDVAALGRSTLEELKKLRTVALKNSRKMDIEAWTRTFVRLDDLMRKAYGIQDAPQSLDVTLGKAAPTLGMLEQQRLLMERCGAIKELSALLPKEGKTIDISPQRISEIKERMKAGIIED